MLFRQGDVLVMKVENMPENLKLRKRDRDKRIVLAEGEATGHAHAILEPDAKLFCSSVKPQGDDYLEAPSGAKVVHEEHDTILLPPGVYKIIRQREYTPEKVRRVID